MNVVSQRLPCVFRNALENRQTEEAEEDQNPVAVGGVAVNPGDHVLNDLRAGKHVCGEVIHGQTDGHERHEVKKSRSGIGKNTRQHPFWILLGVRDDTPNLLAQNLCAGVDVFGSHHVFLPAGGMGPRHDRVRSACDS